MDTQNKPLDRRIDLDWIRIAAFGLLILYHVGMCFVPWYYHVKSSHLVPGLEPFMLVLNPWRLSLLFLVAGTATRYMSSKIAPAALIASRSQRLLIPLLFGMVVIVPPQAYWEVTSRHLYESDFFSFYTQRYYAFAAEFCSNGPCLMLPTWNHLWFVVYLWVYTLLTVTFAALAPGFIMRLDASLARGLSGAGLLILPALAFVFYRIMLFPHFPQTNALFGDWYNHALYFSMFAIGYLIARSKPVWDAMMQWRWAAVLISLAAFAVYLLARTHGPPSAPGSKGTIYAQAVYGLYQWNCIIAVLGFGKRWIATDTPTRRYLTDAIFPYYILHQTVIVGCAFALRDKGLPAAAEAAIIIAVTAVSCALGYEIIKRFDWLRILFGLKAKASAFNATRTRDPSPRASA